MTHRNASQMVFMSEAELLLHVIPHVGWLLFFSGRFQLSGDYPTEYRRCAQNSDLMHHRRARQCDRRTFLGAPPANTIVFRPRGNHSTSWRAVISRLFQSELRETFDSHAETALPNQTYSDDIRIETKRWTTKLDTQFTSRKSLKL